MLGIGLVPTLLSPIGKKAWAILVDIIRGFFKEADWQIFPSWKFPKACRRSCYHIRTIPKAAGNAFSSGWKLTFLVLLISTLITFSLHSAESHDKYHVVVVGSEDLHVNEIKKYLFEEGTVFSLTYLENANKAGDGICLNESQQGWLKEFRTAITECMKQTRARDSSQEDPVLRVMGFSSSAPASPDHEEDKMANCDFANRRAKEVAAFLADKDKKKWSCKDTKIERTQYSCASESENDWVTVPTNNFRFRLEVRQWNNHADMVNGRPANDGSPEDGLTSPAELLNRSVHIKIPKDFCQVT